MTRIPAIILLLAAGACGPPAAARVTADADSLRAAYMAAEMAMNRPGTQAADFRMLMADGTEHSLSDFRGRRLLLVLFDPECDDCHRALAALADAKPADLPALAVYVDGDAGLWPKAVATAPEGWDAALDTDAVYSAGIYTPELTPGIYLLDADGIVLARSSSAAEIIPLLNAVSPL